MLLPGCVEDRNHQGYCLIEGLMLPHPDHPPARRGQRRVRGPVAFDVAAQLG